MPKSKRNKRNKRKSRKRKGGRIPAINAVTGMVTDMSKKEYQRYIEAQTKQKERQRWRNEAERNFNFGPTSTPINPHISFHLGKKLANNQWEGDGYYEYAPGVGAYCYKKDGEVNKEEEKNKEKMTEFTDKKIKEDSGEFCCGMGEVKAYDSKGNLMKYENGDIVTMPAPKIPNIAIGSCDEPINITNNLCSGGEVYVKQHNKSLCCPLGQTPDIATGECREDLNNKEKSVLLGRAKRIADTTGVTRFVGTTVKGATVVAAGGVGACFVFPPCAIVLAIAICIGIGLSFDKINDLKKDKKKLKEIIDNGHELLARLGEIQENVDGKYKKEDSMKAAGLLARIRDCSRKLVKQPSDIGDEYMAKLEGKIPDIKYDKKEDKWYRDLTVPKITKTGLIVGKILDCCNEQGNHVDCGKNTHVKVSYVPRPDNLSQTLLRKTGKNANNVRLITAFDETHMRDENEKNNEFNRLKNKLHQIRPKGFLTNKEYKKMLKLASGEGTKILDKNTLSSRGGTGFAKVLKRLYAGKGAIRQYNNAMNEIQALIDEIDKAESEEREKAESLANAIKKSKEKVRAIFKRAVKKISTLRSFGNLGKLATKEQIYPITFKDANDFNTACSKFA